MLKVADFEADFPDHELVIYRNTATPIEGWPRGFECLIAVPKRKLAELEAAGKPPPFWRHGEVMNVTPPGGGTDGGDPHTSPA